MRVRDVTGVYRKVAPSTILEAAGSYLESTYQREPVEVLQRPDQVATLVQSRLATKECEIFAVIWLNSRHHMIKWEEMFRGTIDGASVYPREVVKSGLQCNAAACILAHNHPSGIAEPSDADRHVTRRIRDALDLLDIRLLDHIVIAGGRWVSMAQRGIM